jgi:hypothetical protein
MRIRSHFRRGALASGVQLSGLGLFGTAGLSGVSAFATARTLSPAAAADGTLISRDTRHCREATRAGILPLFG